MKSGIHSILWRTKLGQLRTKLARRRAKKRSRINYIRWLVSAEGPKPAPCMRSFVPRLTTRALLWTDELRRGSLRKPHGFDRLYLPSHPQTKVCAIRWHARHYKLAYFVETGTFLGTTTAAVADTFKQCFTIELSDELHRRARIRFANVANVRCLHGDSGKLIAGIIRQLEGPALFWLDAHNSGGITAHAGYDPMLTELAAILAEVEIPHVILIDDARDHPLDQIKRMVPDGGAFAVRNDIVRIVPRADTLIDPAAAR